MAFQGQTGNLYNNGVVGSGVFNNGQASNGLYSAQGTTGSSIPFSPPAATAGLSNSVTTSSITEEDVPFAKISDILSQLYNPLIGQYATDMKIAISEQSVKIEIDKLWNKLIELETKIDDINKRIDKILEKIQSNNLNIVSFVLDISIGFIGPLGKVLLKSGLESLTKTVTTRGLKTVEELVFRKGSVTPAILAEAFKTSIDPVISKYKNIIKTSLKGQISSSGGTDNYPDQQTQGNDIIRSIIEKFSDAWKDAINDWQLELIKEIEEDLNKKNSISSIKAKKYLLLYTSLTSVNNAEIRNTVEGEFKKYIKRLGRGEIYKYVEDPTFILPSSGRILEFKVPLLYNNKENYLDLLATFGPANTGGSYFESKNPSDWFSSNLPFFIINRANSILGIQSEIGFIYFFPFKRMSITDEISSFGTLPGVGTDYEDIDGKKVELNYFDRCVNHKSYYLENVYNHYVPTNDRILLAAHLTNKYLKPEFIQASEGLMQSNIDYFKYYREKVSSSYSYPFEEEKKKFKQFIDDWSWLITFQTFYLGIFDYNSPIDPFIS